MRARQIGWEHGAGFVKNVYFNAEGWTVLSQGQIVPKGRGFQDFPLLEI